MTESRDVLSILESQPLQSTAVSSPGRIPVHIDSERRNAILELASTCREHVTDEVAEGLREYLRDSPDMPERKVAVIGRLARDVARMEFLLGWIYYGGYAPAHEKDWEPTENEGVFVDHYQQLMRGEGLGDEAWCAQFTGYTMDRLGFRFGGMQAGSNAQRRRVFSSGWRLLAWSRNGQDVAGNQLVSADRTLANALYGGHAIQITGWDDVMGSGKVPQPGDIFSINDLDHTIMVDDYDVANQILYTVEGNRGDAVRARSIDLNTDAGVVGERTLWLRMGLEWFVDNADLRSFCVLTDDYGNGDENTLCLDPGITAEETESQLDPLVERLKGVCLRYAWIEQDGDRVYDWIGGRDAGGGTR